MTARYSRADEGLYTVSLGDTELGAVFHVWMPSHIRRGRSQASPWWGARLPDGTRVVRDGIDIWQSRTDARDALLHELGR